MPENTVYVGRPTKWGNPYKVSFGILPEHSIEAYEIWITTNIKMNPWKYDLNELKGKDLACFCPILNKNKIYTPCHADVLIKLCKDL
jgi:hypothetical protein